MPTPQTLPPSTRDRVRTTDPETSIDAAVKSGKELSRMQRIVFTLFNTLADDDGPGLTDSELCRRYEHFRDVCGWPVVRYETPRKRRSDLSGKKLQLLRDSGIRRLNEAGSPEVVWEVAS